jgi:phospholipase D1/2
MQQTSRVPKIVRLPAPPVKPPTTAAVKAWVQVLRSAPRKMLQQEAAAKNKKTEGIAHAQNNCLKAMLTAIQSARYFLYIEGQFFQSDYGVEDTRLVTKDFRPMAAMTDATSSPSWKSHMDELGLHGVAQEDVLKKIDFTKIGKITEDKSFIKDIKFAAQNAAAAKASQSLGVEQKYIMNPIGRAIVNRIERAIADGQPFHVYMVLPVHPEGTLDTLNIMTQVHYTMQSLVFGVDSLLNGVRRAIAAGMLMREKKTKAMGPELEIVRAYSIEKLTKVVEDKWKDYLTLLNLRNWAILKDEETGKDRPVTEQIYVHSKLLIADDIVAILGSANINDRSQLGDRDSELAIIVRDDVQLIKQIDGKSATPISAKVYDLRRRLWYKLFGLTDGARHPANSLRGVIDTPAAPSTWKAIQKIAFDNAVAYQIAFPFVPRVTGVPSSIWPTWDVTGKKLRHYMPFHDHFWRNETELDKRDTKFTWAPSTRGPERAPVGVQGFIVALPISWTAGENNDSKMNRSLLASSDSAVPATEVFQANDSRTAWS